MSRKKKPSKPVPYKPLEETYSPVLTVKEKPLSVGRSRGGMTYNNAMLQLTAAVSFARECFVENFDRWSQSCFDLFAELNERFPEGERY